MIPGMPTPITHLLYLHGFRSSPQSNKARMVAAHVQARHPALHWWCPQLPPSPGEAARLIQQGTADWPRESMAVVGSSLGGFYARWLALHTGCRAVLLNPAVHPARDLARHVGQQTSWHDPNERFDFSPAYVQELATLEADIERLAATRAATEQSQLAVIAKGDEVLDWREMLGFCAGGQVRLLEGGDHAISDFAEHLGAVMRFIDPV